MNWEHRYKKPSPNDGEVLAQHHRQWPGIKPSLGEHPLHSDFSEGVLHPCTSKTISLNINKQADTMFNPYNAEIAFLNPLSPRDALKHHFTSVKTNLIFPQLEVFERKFSWNWFTNTWQFSLIFHPHQIIFIHYKSRIAKAIRGLKWMEMTMVNSGLKGLSHGDQMGFFSIWNSAIKESKLKPHLFHISC